MLYWFIPAEEQVTNVTKNSNRCSSRTLRFIYFYFWNLEKIVSLEQIPCERAENLMENTFAVFFLSTIIDFHNTDIIIIHYQNSLWKRDL